jgi:hypothetical protein
MARIVRILSGWESTAHDQQATRTGDDLRVHGEIHALLPSRLRLDSGMAVLRSISEEKLFRF